MHESIMITCCTTTVFTIFFRLNKDGTEKGSIIKSVLQFQCKGGWEGTALNYGMLDGSVPVVYMYSWH